ncbi:MAG: transposase [Candidatus Desantisbacteria bacterium]
MARQLRIEFGGVFYHITSRGNLRDKIFFEDKDKEKFLEVLERTKERYGYLLHAYILMDNHYHLLIETPKANISQIMQNINTSYTVYINRRYQRNGHLLQGRFKSIVVDKAEYLITLSRYIHLNPIRAKIVETPEDYKWTSYRAFIGKENNSIVDITDTLLYFSKTRSKAEKAYREFVEEGIRREENPFNDIELKIILGGKDFKAKIMNLLDRIKVDDELPQIKRLVEKMPIERVIEGCSKYYGKDREWLLKKGKGKDERRVAIYLSKVLSGKKNIEIGKYFDIKGPAVSGIMSAIEERLKQEQRLKVEMEHLKRMIINEV